MKMPTEKSWYEKMAAKEGDHEISAGHRLTSTINPTPEEIAEFERLQLEALPTWARDRISQQDAELERLRREVDRLEVSNQTVADELGNEIGRLQRELAEARKAAFIEAAEIAYAYECSLADYDGSVDAKHFYEGGVGDASIGISKALRAKAEETRT